MASSLLLLTNPDTVQDAITHHLPSPPHHNVQQLSGTYLILFQPFLTNINPFGQQISNISQNSWTHFRRTPRSARPSLMQVHVLQMSLSTPKGQSFQMGTDTDAAAPSSTPDNGRRKVIALRVKFRSAEVVARNVVSLEDLGPCEFMVNYHSHKFDSLKIDVFRKSTLKSKHIGRIRIPISQMENWHSGTYTKSYPSTPPNPQTPSPPLPHPNPSAPSVSNSPSVRHAPIRKTT
ncbi:hypothetical protein BC829DRAFT_235519 [Chytridium lagenaria]|nr:hypothetical protein BC829DRAFT_235519 [Chytridium lagenaria]